VGAEVRVSTDEMRANKGLGHVSDARAVQWALGMLASGATSDALYVLAAATPPFHSGEMNDLLDDAFKDLGIEPIRDETEAALTLARVRIEQALRGELGADEVLLELKNLYESQDHCQELYIFFCLYWAKCDLESVGYQYYWDEGTRENIDQVIASEFEKWIRSQKSATG
jgi:hypothetical protein